MAQRDVAGLPVTAAAAGWAAGEVSLEPDELRADDRRPFAVRIVPPATVSWDSAETGPFLAEALRALARAGQIHPGTSGAVRMGSGTALAGAPAVVFPPRDPVRLGAANRALAADGVPWRFGPRVEDRLVDNGHRAHDPEPHLNDPVTGPVLVEVLSR